MTIVPADLPALDAPFTNALRAALPQIREHTARTDLLFLERWEISPQPGSALALRVHQIRRANPALAAAIRAEIAAGLTLPPRRT